MRIIISPLIFLSLLGCGDKETTSSDTGEVDTDTDTVDDTGGDTGEALDSFACDVLGTTPATIPIDTTVSLTVHLSCDDDEAALDSSWTFSFGGQVVDAAPSSQGDEIVLSVEGLSTSGLLAGSETSTVAAENPIFVGMGGAHENVLHLHRPVDQWTASLPAQVSERVSAGMPDDLLLADLSGDGVVDMAGVYCDADTCELGLSLGDGGDFDDWSWVSLGALSGAGDQIVRIAGMGTEVVVFFGQDGVGEITTVGVSSAGFVEAKTVDITDDLSDYGFTPDTVVDVLPVESRAATSFAVLLSGASKGTSSCDDKEDFALWMPDGSVSIFQGPATCSSLDDGKAAMGLAGSPSAGTLPGSDQVVLWTATTADSSTWSFHVWSTAASAPSTEAVTFSAKLPGMSGADIWVSSVNDANEDGFSELLVTAMPADAQGYIALLPATSGKTWGAPRWLTLDGDITQSGPTPVRRERGSGMATGRRQHKPISITKPIDQSSPLLFTLRTDGDQIVAATFKDIISGDQEATVRADGVDIVGQSSSAIFAVVIGLNNTKSDPEVPLDALLEEGEVAFVSANTAGEAIVSLPLEPTICADGGCPATLAALGGGSRLILSNGSISITDGSILFKDQSTFTLTDALLVGDGGLRQAGDVLLVRRATEPGGDLEILTVEGGAVTGSLQVGHAGEDGSTSAHFDWSGANQALTGGLGDSGGGLYWTSLATEWLAGVSAGGGTMLTGVDVVDIIQRAEGYESVDIEDLGTPTLIGDEVSAAPLPGPRVVGGWLDAPSVYIPEATRLAELGEGSTVTADIVAVIGSKDTGCPWRTVLIPGLDDDVSVAAADMVELSSSDREDCADLERPSLAADVLGTGGQQIITEQWDGEDLTLRVYFRQDGALFTRDHKPLKIAKRIDKASPLLSAGDVNGDGLQDLYIDALVSDLGGSGLLLSDGGRFSSWEEPMEVPFSGYERHFEGFSSTNAAPVDGEIPARMPIIRDLRAE